MVGLLLARMRGARDLRRRSDRGHRRPRRLLRGGRAAAGGVAGQRRQVLWVPLLVKAPGQTAGQIDDRPARTIDVLPTMADVLDVDMPDDVDGVSLLESEPAPGPDERRVFDWGFNRLEPNADGYSLIDGATGFRRPVGPAPAGRGRRRRPALLPVGPPWRPGRQPGRRLPRRCRATTWSSSSTWTAAIARSAAAQQDRLRRRDDRDRRALGRGRRRERAHRRLVELQTTGDPGERRFWGLVPPEFLRDDGEDVFELYVIEGDGPTPRLAPSPPARDGEPCAQRYNLGRAGPKVASCRDPAGGVQRSPSTGRSSGWRSPPSGRWSPNRSTCWPTRPSSATWAPPSWPAWPSPTRCWPPGLAVFIFLAYGTTSAVARLHRRRATSDGPPTRRSRACGWRPGIGVVLAVARAACSPSR